MVFLSVLLLTISIEITLLASGSSAKLVNDESLDGTVRPDLAANSNEIISSGVTSDDLIFYQWSKWTHCTTRCVQKRHRECDDPDECDNAIQRQTRDCDFGRCRGRRASATIRRGITRQLQDVLVNLLYNEWSEWTMCTRSCKRRRFRTCAMDYWCKNMLIMEEKKCFHEGTKCELVWSTETEIDPEELDDGERELRKDKKKKKKVALEPTVNPALAPNPETCGKRPAAPTPRIVGGYEARRGSWPWQVAITNKRGEQYCGGVLVAPQWVITAAHCVRKNGRRRRIAVRVGEYDLMEADGTEVDMKVETDFPHPKFDIGTIESDIAVVKLKEPVPERPDLGFACIPEKDDVVAVNTLCFAIGWGKVKETHKFGTDVLREAPVPLVDDKKCQSAFEYEILSSQMCAGYKRGGMDTCAGDSGGPLMCEVEVNHVKRWFVYGITSFGEGCGDKGKYGIYTKLTLFSDWIKNVTQPTVHV